MATTVAPFGAWKSPISADLLASAGVALAQIELDGDDIYWLESRPQEGGRSVVVRRTPDGQRHDVAPPGFNARTRVHEYGGGSYAVASGTVYFSNFADQRIYRQDDGGAPRALTPEGPLRFADFVVDAARHRLIGVREDHTESSLQPKNTLVAVALDGDEAGGTVLVSGNDFYSSACLSPDGTRLAWLTWNHPNMPWDGTELWVAEIAADGSLVHGERVAGGARESIFQPEWSPDGTLHFVSDRSNWWNLYRWRDGQIEPLHSMAAEFGVPQWQFGYTTYGFAAPETIICAYTAEGTWRLARLDTRSGELTPYVLPYTRISGVQVTPTHALFQAGSPAMFTAVVRLELASGASEVLRESTTTDIPRAYFSVPQAVEFPTEHGLTAHGFFYPPTNPDFAAPAGEKPPLLVLSHGGPTSATDAVLSLGYQYWTSRGFALLDVNYGGSTGYGRAYRERLNGQWGVVDLDDCVNGAQYLVARGLVNGDRLAIRGGSAGGYTTLCALTFRDLFKAGASHFGISNLEGDFLETHKFESHYSVSMIGPYPERQDVYYARSPIHFADRITCPVIFFQGLDDKVVLPGQSVKLVEAMKANGVPVAYLAYEGEGHGFRKAENIRRTAEAELYFYSRVFGFPLAEPVAPVEITHLP
jgi:dipeptidyl aminopeptidase/acylaminoacyl peptidase